MKKYLIMFLLILLLFPLHASTQNSSHSMINQVIQHGVLRVGVSSFIPWAMQDKNGEFIGFEIDLAERLAKDLGVTLQLIPTRWAGIIPALMAGKFDILIGGICPSTERNLRVNFSIPYDYALIEPLAFAEKTKNLRFPEDFNNDNIIIILRSGSSAIPVAKKLFPKATLRYFDDEAIALQDLSSGNAHIFLTSAPLPEIEEARSKGCLKKLTNAPLVRQPISFAIRKGDYDSMNVLDTWIRIIKEEGWLAERKNYWFNNKQRHK